MLLSISPRRFVCTQTCKTHGCTEAFPPKTTILQNNQLSITKYTLTLVSKPNGPQQEYRQFVKQQEDRSNVLEPVAVSDEWNEPGSLQVIHNVCLFPLAKCFK